MHRIWGSPILAFSFLGFPLHFPESVATLDSVSNSSDQKDGKCSRIPSAGLCHTVTMAYPRVATKWGSHPLLISSSKSRLLSKICLLLLSLQRLWVYFALWIFCPKFIAVVHGDWSAGHLLHHTESRTPENIQKILSITTTYHYSHDQSSLAESQNHRYPGQALWSRQKKATKIDLWNIALVPLCKVCKAVVLSRAAWMHHPFWVAMYMWGEGGRVIFLSKAQLMRC